MNFVLLHTSIWDCSNGDVFQKAMPCQKFFKTIVSSYWLATSTTQIETKPWHWGVLNYNTSIQILSGNTDFIDHFLLCWNPSLQKWVQMNVRSSMKHLELVGTILSSGEIQVKSSLGQQNISTRILTVRPKWSVPMILIKKIYICRFEQCKNKKMCLAIKSSSWYFNTYFLLQ